MTSVAEALANRIRAALLVPGSAIDLALLRIVFFAMAVPIGVSKLPAQMAELPDELRTIPSGAGWLYDLLPPDGSLARVASIVLLVAALAALFGWHARAAATVWVLTAVWAFGIPNLFGKVDHNHHILWFAALLAASPCADVLSLDAVRRRRAALAAPAVRYGLPVRVWWLLIGLVYFFPGLWKVAAQGLGWASPANLRVLLHAQWAAVDGFVPPFRIDDQPVLLVLVGLGTLAFELGFVFLVFTRLRPVAVVCGLSFHLGTYLLLDISFTSLVISYVAFVPWHRSFGAVPTGSAEHVGRVPQHPDRLTVGIAGVLVAGVLVFGATETVDGWPFAAYPTFAERLPDRRQSLEFEVELADGSTRLVSADEVFSWVPETKRNRIPGQLLRLSPRAQADALREVDLPAVGQRVRSLRVFQVVFSTDPDDPRQVGRVELLEVELD